MTRRYALAAPVALAALVVVWWATRFVDGGHRECLDALMYFLPTYAATWERFRAGIVPLWNPYQLCGIPWIGTLQGGTFYPFHVFYGFLPLNVALAIVGVLHLVIGTLGMWVFIRRLGLGHAPAFLAAVVFALRGRFATALGAPNMLEALAWLPIGAVALVELARTPSRRAIALLAAATAASFLAGYPQPTIYIIYTWGSVLVVLLLQERPSLRDAGIRIAAFGIALALGSMIAAIQLLPALEMIGVGTRAAAGLDDRTMFHSGPILTSGLLSIGRASISGAALAFGLIVLALAPVAVVASGRRILGWWAVVFSFLVAAWSVGRYLPIFDLYLMLPAMRLFREPSRILVVLDFSVAIGAALGLSAAIANTAPGGGITTWRRIVPIAIMALALVGVLELTRRGWAPNAGARVPVFAIVTLVAMVALLVVTGPSRRALLAGTIAAAAAIEIAFNPPWGIRTPYRASDVAVYDEFAPELRRLATLAGSNRVWRALPGVQLTHILKVSTWHKLRTINDYEPVNLQRQSDFFTYFVDGSTVPKRRPWLFAGDIATVDPPPGGTSPAHRRRLLDLAAVRWVVFSGPIVLLNPAVREFVQQAGLVRRDGDWNLLVLENPAAFPRAFVTYRVYSAPRDLDSRLAILSSPVFDPLVASLVEGPLPFHHASDAPPRGHAVAFVEDGETAVELEVKLERPGLVVLADSFYPGWRARVGDDEVPIVATNHLFRGVPVPAGTHRVRFTYEPASVRIGALVTAVGLLVLLWLAVSGRRPSVDGSKPANSRAG